MSYSVVICSRNIGNLTKCVGQLREMGETCRIIVVWDDRNSLPPNQMWQFPDQDQIERNFLNGVPPIMNHIGIPVDRPGMGGCDVIWGETPFIFARNCNIGIRAAGGDDVVLANDDALLRTPIGFGVLRHQFKHHPDFGAICPSFTPGSVGTLNLVWSGRPSLAEEKVMLVFACVYIPRSTIDKVGLLDDRFGVNAGGPGPRGYGLEDDDYSLRIRQAGLKLGVYDGVLVDHVPQSTGLKSTFRHDPEHPHDVRAHEELFRKIHGHWPEGHGYAPGKVKA